MKQLLLIFSLLASLIGFSQQPVYPYPVQYLPLRLEQQQLRMAYMDVQPEHPNGKTVMLLHGKNFNGFYWKGVIDSLFARGYRVIVPDQLGWGLSDKPNIHYSFHLLANNTRILLDSLGIQQVYLVGHSMGGMLATRFTLMFPARVSRLVLENPIGIEDYKTFVPYVPLDSQYRNELKATYASLKQYQQSYYPAWKPEYEAYVQAQWQALQYPDFEQATRASAITYEMIYEQPVRYEFSQLRLPVLLVIGQSDRTIVGKNLLAKNVAARHGNYPALGKWLQQQVKGSKLAPLQGVGHIPHIQVPQQFMQQVLAFFK